MSLTINLFPFQTFNITNNETFHVHLLLHHFLLEGKLQVSTDHS